MACLNLPVILFIAIALTHHATALPTSYGKPEPIHSIKGYTGYPQHAFMNTVLLDHFYGNLDQCVDACNRKGDQCYGFDIYQSKECSLYGAITTTTPYPMEDSTLYLREQRPQFKFSEKSLISVQSFSCFNWDYSPLINEAKALFPNSKDQNVHLFVRVGKDMNSKKPSGFTKASFAAESRKLTYKQIVQQQSDLAHCKMFDNEKPLPSTWYTNMDDAYNQDKKFGDPTFSAQKITLQIIAIDYDGMKLKVLNSVESYQKDWPEVSGGIRVEYEDSGCFLDLQIVAKYPLVPLN